jgi:hypothetical protein
VLTVNVAPLAATAGSNNPVPTASDSKPLDCLIMLSP